jgi:hypothetical protein
MMMSAETTIISISEKPRALMATPRRLGMPDRTAIGVPGGRGGMDLICA